MLRELTERLLDRVEISFEESECALNGILDGNCTEVAIAGFLTALAAKGETAAEVAGMAKALRDHAVPVRPKAQPLVDVVGTGGDSQATFNISTMAALVAAGAGVAVAKHGNRAITSKCGSADVLAGLGVKIDASPDVIERCIDEANIGFMFAPNHHPAMKYVQPIRKALGFRTVFNVLGPLANPAKVSIQITGVAKPYLVEIMAQALKQLGISRAMVVHSEGMDEFSTCGPTDVAELRNGKITRYVLHYSEYGFSRGKKTDLAGGTLEDNIAITRSIIEGRETGPKTDVVVLTAAAAIMISGKAPDLAQGIMLAKDSIETGKAAKAMEKLSEISNS